MPRRRTARVALLLLPALTACAPTRTDRAATLTIPSPSDEARVQALLHEIDDAKEAYALSTYAAKSHQLLAEFPTHAAADRVRYELAVQLVAQSMTATTSTTAVEARRLLAEHAERAMQQEQRFEAELLLLKFSPRSEQQARAERMLQRYATYVDVDQVYLFLISAAAEVGDVATQARWARALLDLRPNHEEAPRLRDLIRRGGLARMPWDASELAGLRGRFAGKVVLVDFFATWCTPCLAELPRLRAIYEKRRGPDFEMLSVSVDEDGGAYQAFVGQAKLPWPVVRSLPGANGLSGRCGVTDLPTYFVVERDGRVLSTELRGPAVLRQLDALLTPPR